jgi:peptidoglycan/LPS O-acetylase OafA/YrhL
MTSSGASEKPHVGYIDGLRAIAVSSVLLYHSFIANDATFPDWVYCGSRGVALFFVISGFCLAFPFLHAWRSRGTFTLDSRSFLKFLLRRFSRIAPPFYAALAIFALLAFTPFGFPNAHHQDTSFANAARDFVANLFFLTAKSPLLNASFWTLGIEARWYLLCPLLIALYVRSRIGFGIVAAAMYGLYFFSPYSIADEGVLPCFMAGILAADLVLAGPTWLRFAWLPAGVALGVAIFAQSRVAESDLGDPFWHVTCFLLVIAGSTGAFRRVLEWKPIAFVGIASYSIYLSHGPFIESFVKSGVPRPLAAFGGLAIGLFAYRVIERPLASDPFRRKLETAIAAPFRLLANRPALEFEVTSPPSTLPPAPRTAPRKCRSL